MNRSFPTCVAPVNPPIPSRRYQHEAHQSTQPPASSAIAPTAAPTASSRPKPWIARTFLRLFKSGRQRPARELGQNCIVINVAVALLNRRKKALAFKSWCLEVPDHARARMLQRAGIGYDLTRALRQATDNFLSSDTAVIAKHVDTKEVFYLPCGPGLLLCSPIYCRTPENKYFTYSRARTWISDAMVRPDPNTIVSGNRRYV